MLPREAVTMGITCSDRWQSGAIAKKKRDLQAKRKDGKRKEESRLKQFA